MDIQREAPILTTKKMIARLVVQRRMIHTYVKIGAGKSPNWSSRESGEFGSTARKEVIRCLMVQHRGR